MALENDAQSEIDLRAILDDRIDATFAVKGRE